MKKSQVKLLFRKPLPGYHSIEGLFRNIFNSGSDPEIEVIPYVSKSYSTGILNRIRIGIEFCKNRGKINHITGDLNFAGLFLPTKNTILTIHDISSSLQGKGIKKKIIALFWLQLPLRRLKYITVISEKTKADILGYMNISPDKIHVIENCYNPAFRHIPKEFNAAHPTFLLCGTTQNKNLERVVIALSKIKCRLLILGFLYDHQIKLLKKHQIDYQSFTGISDQEVVNIYAQADIVLFPSLSEGFGLPILEAQAVGRVLITSNIEPMASVAGNGAILVDPYNQQNLENAIEKAITDENLRNALITNGLENVKKYHPQKTAEKYFQLYKKVLKDLEK